jgi:hypothetical protein
MKLPFLRKVDREDPLVVAMTGVRLGDRLLYIGATADLVEPLAARVGLSGQITVVAADAETVRATAEGNGLLVDATTTVPDQGDYNLAIVEARGAWSDSLRGLLALVRAGGRLIVIAGESRGWLGRLRGPAEPAPPDSEIVRLIEAAGWTAARGIGGRGDLRFVESFKR